jgi:hypothetical protein
MFFSQTIRIKQHRGICFIYSWQQHSQYHGWLYNIFFIQGHQVAGGELKAFSDILAYNTRKDLQLFKQKRPHKPKFNE